MPLAYHDEINDRFKKYCNGKASCTFRWKQSALPVDECVRGAVPSTYWKYLMVASCSDTSIELFDDIKVGKATVGVVVVLFDLLATFWFWCSMLALRKFHNVT